MSIFAAGCAVCGADLQAHREAQGARQRAPRVPVRRAPVRLPGEDIGLVAVLVLLALFAPLFGLAFGALATYHHHRRTGRTTIRSVAAALALISLLALLLPGWRWGLVGWLY